MEDIYQPCPCGSGKKFKFCCRQKAREFEQMSLSELVKKAPDFKIHECLVRTDWEKDGLAPTLVVRQIPNLKYLFAFFYVEASCLGVKDLYLEANASLDDIESIKRRFPDPMISISYEEARSLILGAIDFAKSVGFDPHPGWERAKSIIEAEKPYVHLFDFGREGKPVYLSSPSESPEEILATLNRHARSGVKILPSEELGGFEP